MDIKRREIHNYYEKLVLQQIESELKDTHLADIPGALEDIACLALNQLPARYVRHAIDTAFYLSIPEQQDMLKMVVEAVEKAASYVSANPREPLSTELPASLP